MKWYLICCCLSPLRCLRLLLWWPGSRGWSWHHGRWCRSGCSRRRPGLSWCWLRLRSACCSSGCPGTSVVGNAEWEKQVDQDRRHFHTLEALNPPNYLWTASTAQFILYSLHFDVSMRYKNISSQLSVNLWAWCHIGIRIRLWYTNNTSELDDLWCILSIYKHHVKMKEHLFCSFSALYFYSGTLPAVQDSVKKVGAASLPTRKTSKNYKIKL